MALGQVHPRQKATQRGITVLKFAEGEIVKATMEYSKRALLCYAKCIRVQTTSPVTSPKGTEYEFEYYNKDNKRITFITHSVEGFEKIENQEAAQAQWLLDSLK